MIYFFDKDMELKKLVVSSNVYNPTHQQVKNGMILAQLEFDIDYAFMFIDKVEYFGYYYNETFYLHRIKTVEPDFADNIMTVAGNHIFFDDMIGYNYIKDKRPENRDAAFVLKATIGEVTRWDIVMTDVTDTLSSSFYYLTPMEALEQIVKDYQVEYEPRILFDGKKINAYQLHVANKLGNQDAKRVRFGDKVLQLKYDIDYSDISTAIIGRGKGEEVGDGYGRRIDFKDISFSRNGVVSPIGKDYMEDTRITDLYGYDDGTPKYEIVVFEDITDARKLAEETYNYYVEKSKPKMLFETEVTDIGIKHIGDTLLIVKPENNLAFKVRVEKIDVDLHNPEVPTMELGDYEHFQESKVERRNRLDNERIINGYGAAITNLKRDFDERFDNVIEQWNSEYEQALIDVHAQIEADRENMTNLIEGTRAEFTDNLNAEISQVEDYAEQQAQAKADSVQTNLDSFKNSHQQIYDEVNGNIVDINAFLGDKSETLKQQFDKVHTDYGTLQTELSGVESDLTATKSDLQQQLDDAKKAFDELEIGGRNLLQKSELDNRAVQGGLTEVSDYEYLLSNENLEDEHPFLFNIEVEPGNYVISGKFKAPASDYELRKGMFRTSSTSRGTIEYIYLNTFRIDDSEEYVHFSIPIEMYIKELLGMQIYLHDWTTDPLPWFYIKELQVEKGTVVTDWTPAPEDTEQKITTLNQQIEFIDGQLSAKLEQTDIEPINNKITEYGNSLTANAQSIESLLSKTELHDGDITKWSNQTTANAESITSALTRINNTETGLSKAQADITANADEISLKASQAELNSATGEISSLAGKLSVQAGEISSVVSKVDGNTQNIAAVVQDTKSITSTVAEIENDIAAQGSEIEQALNSITSKVWLGDVGGKNLLPQTVFPDDFNAWNSRGTNVSRHTTTTRGLSDYLWVNRPDGNANAYMAVLSPLLTEEVVEGHEYTIQFKTVHRVNVNELFSYVYLMNEDGTTNQSTLNDSQTVIEIGANDYNGNQIQLHTISVKANFSGRARILIGTHSVNSGAARFYVKEPKIEKGKATAYSRAPEDFLQTSELKITPDYWQLGSTRIDGNSVSSVLRGTPDSIDAIVSEMNLTGNLNVKGQIETISMSAVEAEFGNLFANQLTTNVIKSDHIEASLSLVRKLFANSARIDELITQTHFSNSIKTLSLDAVDADISNIRTKILQADVINARHVNFTDALVRGIYAHEAFIDNATIRAANIRDLDAISIHANTFSSTYPGSNREITMSNGRAYFKYGSVTVETTSGRKVIIDGNINRSQTMTARMPNLQSSTVTELGSWYYTNSQSYVNVLTEYYVHNARWLVASIGLNKWGYAANIDARMNSSAGYSAYVSTVGLGAGTHYQWMRRDLGEPLDIPTSGMVQYEIKTRDSNDNPRAHLGNRFLTDNPPVG